MIDSVDRQIIRRVQQGIPLVPAPYSIIAAEIGIVEGELLARLRHMRERGMLRKMGAVLQHHKAGGDVVDTQIPEGKAPSQPALVAPAPSSAVGLTAELPQARSKTQAPETMGTTPTPTSSPMP